MTIYILGYYNCNNLGDDAYKVSFKKLFPDKKLCFTNDCKFIKNKDIEGIIYGGGDIINEYFHDSFKESFDLKVIKIGLSIGIPYPESINEGYLNHLDHVFVRNKTDLKVIEKCLGSEFTHYLPDLAFLLDIPVVKKKKKCGVFPTPFIDVEKTNLLIKELSKEYSVTVYRFDTSGTDNDDTKVMKKLHGKLNFKRYTVEEMLKKIASLEIAICARFHSHIFCTLLGIPFISIANTRKCSLYLEENGLQDLMTYDHTLLKSFDYSILNRITEKNKLLLCTDQVQNIMTMFRKNKNKNPHEIYTLIEKNFNLEIIDRDTAILIARAISLEITGDPDSKYVYGTINNIINGEDILQMIKWTIEDFKKIDYQNKDTGVNLSYISQVKDRSVHRSGWNYAMSGLLQHNSEKGIITDTFLERTFFWCEDSLLKKGIIPYTNRWVGFIHHTGLDWYTEYNINNLFKKKSFIQSLETCKAIFVLSMYLKEKILSINNTLNVYCLRHPTEKGLEFDLSKFDGSVIQIGSWLRDSPAIYFLDSPWRKRVLKGSDMNDYFPPQEMYFTKNLPDDPVVRKHIEETSNYTFYKLLKRYIGDVYIVDSKYVNDKNKHMFELDEIKKKVDSCLKSVELLEKVDNNRYDLILQKSLVFVKLLDASAINTLIECMYRNTPILITKHPAVVELLGQDYPMYFETLEDAKLKINKDVLKKTNDYLKTLDKSVLSLDNFVLSFMKAIKEIDI